MSQISVSDSQWFASQERQASRLVTYSFFWHSHFVLSVAEGQAEHRKQIIPALVAVLKEAVQETKAEQESEVLHGIADVDLAGAALLKCGPEAKPMLAKEVLPRLKDLQFHRSDIVRRTADELRRKIEDMP